MCPAALLCAGVAEARCPRCLRYSLGDDAVSVCEGCARRDSGLLRDEPRLRSTRDVARGVLIAIGGVAFAIVLVEQGRKLIELGLEGWGDETASALDFIVLVVSVIAIPVVVGALVWDLVTYRRRTREKAEHDAEFWEAVKEQRETLG